VKPVKIINIREARTHLSRLLERARAGEEIIIAIAKRGEPIARLLPLKARPPKRQSGTLKGLVNLTDAFFHPLPRAWSGAKPLTTRR
jgi:prevent-host-death family protein